MKYKALNKFIAIFIILIFAVAAISNIALADIEISGGKRIKNKGECERHLQYWKESINNWSYIICHYVAYEENGVEYPAYCMQRENHGVGDIEEYDVDITGYLDDVRIWRTIINGYPYKTPKELGVDNEYDAFLATKQAIYCILYDWDAATRFRGADARGERIANAIVNISNEGKYGTQTPYDSGIQINKVGELIDEGEYIVQEYQTNCGANVNKYYITAIAGLPNGSKITNLNNSETLEFNGTEHFKVKIPKNKIDRNLEIVISIQAKAKTYPVFYGKSRIQGTQDYALCFDPYGDITGKCTLNIKGNNGKIKIYKINETNSPISGVEFQLSKLDGTVLQNATTNNDGVVLFKDLYAGTYHVKEINSSGDYLLNEDIIKVDVSYNSMIERTIVNKKPTGTFTMIKENADGSAKIEGVVYRVWSGDGTYNEIHTTSNSGEIKIEGLKLRKILLSRTESSRRIFD